MAIGNADNDDMLLHEGHEIAVAVFGISAACIVCEDCHEVLIDAWPEEED